MSLRAVIRLCPLVALAACDGSGDAPVQGQRIASPRSQTLKRRAWR